MDTRVIERATILGAQYEKTHRLGIIFFQYITNSEKITERLRHLFILPIFFIHHTDKTVVHPVVHKGAVMRCLGLSNLVFMVWELQILAAAVNIKMLA